MQQKFCSRIRAIATHTGAQRAEQDRSLITFAVKTTEFTRCKVYDFADGSFLVVHDTGRTQVNAITA